MAKYLILDWRGSRLVVLVSHESAPALFTAAFVVEGLPASASVAELIAAAHGPLADLVQRHRLKRLGTVILCGREFYEIQLAHLPPAPESEWPEMIAFQTPQLFTTLRDEGVVDFLPMEVHADRGAQLLAVGMSRQTRDALKGLAEQVGLKLLHVCPRAPAAIHALPSDQRPSEPYWLLDAQPGYADISLVEGDRLLQTRAVRWESTTAANPTDMSAPASPASLLADVQALERERKRTQAAAPAGYSQVQRVVCVSSQAFLDAYGQPRELAEGGQGPQLVCLDRLVAPSAQDNVDGSHLSAAAWGALQDLLDSRPPLLDFLHPRDRPAPPDRSKQTRQLLLGLIAVALGSVSFYWWQIEHKNQQVLELERSLQDLNKQVDAYKQVEKQVADIQRWANSHVHWLARLHQLTQALPPADKLRLTSLAVNANLRGGELVLEGHVDSPDTLVAMENGVRSETLKPLGRDRRQDAEGPLSWSFKESYVVEPDLFQSGSGNSSSSGSVSAPSSATSPPAATDAKKASSS